MLAASLAVSSGGPAAAQDAAQGLTSEVEAPVVVTFVSNTSQLHANYEGFSRTSPRATPFTTGSSTDGYQLTSVKVTLTQEGTVGLAVHANGAGNLPGAQVGDAFGDETYDHGSSDGEVTFSGSSVRLAPDTNYWLVVSVTSTNMGQPSIWFSNLGQGVDSGGQSGWSLGGRYHAAFSNQWEEGQLDAPLAVKLSGMVRGPEGVDFSANSTTVGRLEVGTLSTGFLSNRGDRDLFKLEDLPATSNSARDGQANKWSRKRYRVQAWFGDHAPGAEQGGDIFIMEGSPSGSSSLYSSVSDTNEDGLSFFEFEAFPNIDYYAMVVPTAAIQRKSGSGYKLDTRTYTGPYKLQIVDVSNILEMVTTLDVAHPSNLFRATVGTATLADDHAVKFRTGWHGDGYVINRVEAAVSNTDVSAFAANAKVSVYSNSSGSPGTELFTLRTPADIWAGGFEDNEESFWAPSATTANNNLTRNTNYWVVFTLNTGATTGAYKLDLVNTTGETAQQGWVLSGGKTKIRNTTTWAALSTSDTNTSLQVGIYASPNTTGHTHPVPLDAAPTGGI